MRLVGYLKRKVHYCINKTAVTCNVQYTLIHTATKNKHLIFVLTHTGVKTHAAASSLVISFCVTASDPSINYNYSGHMTYLKKSPD